MDNIIFADNTPEDIYFNNNTNRYEINGNLFVKNKSRIRRFFGSPANDPSSDGLDLMFSNWDTFEELEVDPPISLPPTAIAKLAGTFTANCTPRAGYTQKKFYLFKYFNSIFDYEIYQEFNGVIITANSLSISLGVVIPENLKYAWETARDGEAVSLLSNISPVVAVLNFSEKLSLVVGGEVANMQELSGTAWTFSAGGNGVYSPAFTLQQPGLFSDFTHKSVLLNGGTAIRTFTSRNLKEQPLPVVAGTIQEFCFIIPFKFNNTSGDRWLGGLMSTVAGQGYIKIGSGATNSANGSLLFKNNASADVVSTGGFGGTGGVINVALPNLVDLQEGIIAVVNRNVAGVRTFEVYYRKGAIGTGTKIASLTWAATDVTVSQFVLGAAARSTLDKIANVNVQNVLFEWGTPPVEADILDIINTGTFA